jgi:hypothetical protein
MQILRLNKLQNSEGFNSSRFSRSNLAVFALTFVGIGGYLIFRSFAAAPPDISTLPRIPWEGGSNYWKVSNGPQFAKADAAGWDDPSFFPITTWAPNMSDAAAIKALGINTATVINFDNDSSYNPRISKITDPDHNPATDDGLFAIPHKEYEFTDDWTPATVGNDPKMVGWFITDECDMGYSGCGNAAWTQYQELDTQKTRTAAVRAYNDGRFMTSNFGNGVARSFWSPNTMDEHEKLMDLDSIDKYVYTSPEVDQVLQTSRNWPSSANPGVSAGYGWLIDQQRIFQNAELSPGDPAPAEPEGRRPIWVLVEPARPLLNEAGAKTITPDQMEGAVWSGIIHEARGVFYFAPNNDTCGGYSIIYVDNPTASCLQQLQDRQNKLKSIHATIRSLAPVINTQSYVWNFSNDGNAANNSDTMLKTYNGSAYIFAGIGLEYTGTDQNNCDTINLERVCQSLGTNQPTGTKNFILPGGVTGSTVTVVGENRTIPVTNGQFTDTFTNEYSHHIYQITLGPPDTTPPTVSLTAPANGSTVTGDVTLSANASDNTGVAGVQFKVDGSNVGSEVTTSPFSVTWDSTAIANGSHTITAVARDGSNNSTTSTSVTVTVANVPDTTAPTVSLTTPAAGSTVSGSAVNVTASASDNVSVAGVQFKLDGANLQAEDTSSPYSITWDTLSTNNGTHTLTAVARDKAGNTTTSSGVSVTVSNAAANLTMGLTSIGATDDSGNAGQLLVQQAILTQTATIQSMSFYVGTAAGNLRLGVYDSTGATGGPGAKVAETAEFTPITGWNTVTTTTHPTLVAGNYWLAYTPSSSGLHFRLDGAGSFKSTNFTYGPLPATHPAPTASSQAGQWSMYASLVSGGSNPTPPPPPPSGPKPGDINGDNSVNITDLSLLLSSYGQSTTQCVTNNTYTCDLSSPGDGIVNIFDLSILLSKYGT